MADNKSPNNGDLASAKQQLIKKLLDKFAKDIAIIENISIQEALKIAKISYGKHIEYLVSQIFKDQLRPALDDTEVDKLAGITKKLQNKVPSDKIDTLPEIKNTTQETDIDLETVEKEIDNNPGFQQNSQNNTPTESDDQTAKANSAQQQISGNALSQLPANQREASSKPGLGSINPDSQSRNAAPGSSGSNSAPTSNQLQKQGNPNLVPSQTSGGSQSTTNPTENQPAQDQNSSASPSANTTSNSNGASDDDLRKAGYAPKIDPNTGKEYFDDDTRHKFEMAEKDKKSRAESRAIEKNIFGNGNTPPGNDTTTPDPKSKQNTKPGNGNIKPGMGGNTKPGDTSNATPNATVPPNPNLEKYKGRGAGRIAGAAPGGFVRSGENYTGNRFQKDAEPVTIERIQRAADKGFDRSSNVINQAKENIEKGDVDKGEKQLSVAKSIAQKASKLAANARFRVILDRIKQQIILGLIAATPYIIMALIAAIFIGGFVLFTISVICSPVMQPFLPKEMQYLCGGKPDDANANCPSGYTAWVQDPTGKWVQSANNTTTGTTGPVCLEKLLKGNPSSSTVKVWRAQGGVQMVDVALKDLQDIQKYGQEAGVSIDTIKFAMSIYPTEALGTLWNTQNSDSCVGLGQFCSPTYEDIMTKIGKSGYSKQAFLKDPVTQMKATEVLMNEKRSLNAFPDKPWYYGAFARWLGVGCDSGGTCDTQYGESAARNWELLTCNSTNAKDKTTLPQTLATVTNNLKQFFQPIRAEAASDGRNLVVDGIPAGIAYRDSGSLAGVPPDGSGGGIDFTISLTGNYDTGSKGAPVISHMEGEVTYVVNDQSGATSGFGNEVGVYYPSIGITAIYSHMDSVAVKVGDRVSPGSFLGGQGSTGSTRPVGFNHISLNLIKGKASNQGGESSDITGVYDPFLKNMMTYYATNLEKIKAKNYSPTAGVSGNSTSSNVICCPPGVAPTGTGITSQIADIDGLSEDGKKLLAQIASVIEQKEGAVTTVPGGFGVGFEKYNNPGNITASSSLNSEKAAIDKKFPVSAADKAKGITSYVSKDLKNPRFLAFYTPEIGRWYLQDYILYQLTQGDGNFRTAQTWGDFMRAYAPPNDGNATNRPGQGSTSYIDMFKGAGLVETTPLSEVKSKLGLKTSNNVNQENDNLLQKLASVFTLIKAEAQNTNGIEKAQIIVLHITAGGNGTPEADRGQLAFVQNPPRCNKPNCKSYNELILSDGQIEKLQTQGGNVVGTGAGWVYNIDPTTWKAGNARITGASGSGVINSLAYQISYPLSKLKGEEGDRLTSSQVKATAQTLTEFARSGGRAENIFTHASLDPLERSEDRPFINFDGSVNGQLVELVSLIRANGQWKTGNYANMSDQELAAIITMINVENAIAASEKSGDSALPANDLNKLKAAAEKLREQLKNKTFQINQGGSSLIPGACVQASASNNATTTNSNATPSTTAGTLSNAKDAGNEFSQLSKGHLAFMEFIAKERGYTGPFTDNGGPDPAAKAAADKLIAKARSEGIKLLVAGEPGNYGYRGYNSQTSIFLSQIPNTLRYQDAMGTSDKVPQSVKNAYLQRAQSSAPVGYSEHHTGKGMDFIIEGMTQEDLSGKYDKTVATWLATNAPKEGFRLTYPPGSTKGAGYEPWHWFYQS